MRDFYRDRDSLRVELLPEGWDREGMAFSYRAPGTRAGETRNPFTPYIIASLALAYELGVACGKRCDDPSAVVICCHARCDAPLILRGLGAQGPIVGLRESKARGLHARRQGQCDDCPCKRADLAEQAPDHLQ